MALAFSTAVRNARLDAITAQVGASALLRFYDGTRPASGAAISTQVKLAELVCNATFAPAASGGVLTLNAIASDTIADATGTCTWARIVKSDGTTFIMDANVGTSGSDINFDSVAFQANADINMSSFTITEANA